MNKLLSMQEILDLLTYQAEHRAPENDEAGILLYARDYIAKELNELEGDLAQIKGRPSRRMK